MIPAPPPSWRVFPLLAVSELVDEWTDQARNEMFSMLFEASMLQAGHHLARDPEQWGDPLFSYQELKLTVYRRSTPLFHVQYAVDAANRLVYFRGLVPGSQLRGSAEGAA